jgi:hypothetical protein
MPFNRAVAYNFLLCLLAASCNVLTPKPTTVYALADQTRLRSPLNTGAAPLFTVDFPIHSYALNAEQKTSIQAAAAKWDKSKELIIVGSASADDPTEFARVLGQRRAESLRLHLIELGWEAEKIHSISVGNDLGNKEARDKAMIFPAQIEPVKLLTI